MNSEQDGFTLIEVIIVIILTGIVATFMVSLLSSSFKNSPDPLTSLTRQNAVERTIANLNGQYAEDLASGTFSLASFKTGLSGHAVGGAVITSKYISFKPFSSGTVTDEIAQTGSQQWYLKVEVSLGGIEAVTLFSG